MSRGISLHIGLNELDPGHYRDGDGRPWNGRLYGCENDADAMAALAARQGFTVDPPLKNSMATSVALAEAVRAIAVALEPGDLFLLTFSGHGGQVANLDPGYDDEVDRLDETWCLYDRQVLDDELFALFAEFRPGVRIVVFSDSCHSGTVSRGRPGVAVADALLKQLPLEVAIATERANQATYARIQAQHRPARRPRPMQATVVLLAGCQDHEFSRDGRDHGAFTAALLRAWDTPGARRSLRHLFEAAAAGIPAALEQHPSYTVFAFDIGRALLI